jgi:hypothetical protein
MITENERAFADAHPEIATRYADEGLAWLNVYTNYNNAKIDERWERNKDGVLVNVTEREMAREELVRATEALEAIKKGERHA